MVKHLMLALLALTLTAGSCDISRQIGVTIGGQSIVQTQSFIARDLSNAMFAVYRDLLDRLAMIGGMDEPTEDDTGL